MGELPSLYELVSGWLLLNAWWAIWQRCHEYVTF